MGYVLEDKREYQRLEKQSTASNYNVQQELENINFYPNDHVLDAGCGSGLLSRYLRSCHPSIKIEGCDFSAQRIDDAKKNSSNIHFFQSDLTSINKENGVYSKVICRYVFEHLPEPQKVSDELFRVLKKNGQIVVINVDAIMFDVFTEDKVLSSYLTLLKRNFPIDIFAGRKISSYLHKSGFVDINWDIRPMIFKGSELTREIELIKERLSFSQKIMIDIFGSEEHYLHFVKLYLHHIQTNYVPFFYNKFTYTGIKK